MNNIEKLAIEHGKASNTVMRYNEMSQQMLLDGYNFTRSELEAFAKALQSSEPVCEIKSTDLGLYADWNTEIVKNIKEGDKFFTNPPASVPLEKYNKLLDALKEVIGANPTIAFDKPDAFKYVYSIEKARQAIAEAELSEGKEG